ncbi:MAG: glycerophosphodiester phosphodiesterase [Desulfuromonadales bacterium]|nr:glycerophosphodiester phosphodiesterase [Desulfuromonadales bacterium]
MSTHTETLLIAHRGASREAPENTLAAFELAWREGADGIEADFRLTRDGRVVCQHDATTGRTAGVDLVVAEASLDELQRLDVGRWKGTRWQGERIPTLEEVLIRLPTGKMFFIELKSGPEIIEPLRLILPETGVPVGQLRLLAFDAQLVARLKEQLPGIRVCLNVDYRWSLRTRSWSPSRAEILANLEHIGADGLSSQDHALLDAQFVAGLHHSGKEVHVWTVDSARGADHYRGLGVDSIMTNRPGWLRNRLMMAESGGEGR